MSDIVTFPDDENGAVLRNMQLSGDDLSQPRKVDFENIFPSKENALAFACATMTKTDEVRISWYDEAQSWNVQVTRHMVPDYRTITDLESTLRSLAQEHGGDSDGWGCFEVTRQRDA